MVVPRVVPKQTFHLAKSRVKRRIRTIRKKNERWFFTQQCVGCCYRFCGFLPIDWFGRKCNRSPFLPIYRNQSLLFWSEPIDCIHKKPGFLSLLPSVMYYRKKTRFLTARA